MSERIPVHTSRTAAPGQAKVLVFRVDEDLFALHVDWVEAMYPRDTVEVRSVRDDGGRDHPFILHGGAPAPVVDLRDAFGLTSILGAAVGSDYVVARSPGFPLALAADGCVGIRELDLETPPVPSSLVRDGGFPVAHLVALDGRPLAVLDPSHLLEAAERDARAALVQKAREYEECQRQIEALWQEICAQPAAPSVRAYERLCSRSGRSKAAAAAVLVLRHMEFVGEHDPAARSSADAARADAQVPAQERLIRELVCLAAEMATGEVIVPQGDGAEESRLLLAGGRVVQACHGGERGRAAFLRLLAAAPEHFYFVETAAGPDERPITESTVALLIGALPSLSGQGAGAVRARRRDEGPRVRTEKRGTRSAS